MSTITDDQLADATFQLLAAMDSADLDAVARALHGTVMQGGSTEPHWKLDQLLDWTGRQVHGDAWSAELSEACIGAALTMRGVRRPDYELHHTRGPLLRGHQHAGEAGVRRGGVAAHGDGRGHPGPAQCGAGRHSGVKRTQRRHGGVEAPCRRCVSGATEAEPRRAYAG